MEATEARPRVSHIVPQALSVHPDEKAFALCELNYLTVDYKARRRWQFLYVIRDGNVAEWVRDMGNASEFDAPELRLYSFWQDTVGQLMDEADRARWQDTEFKEILLELQGKSTFKQDYVAFVEEREKLIRNQSTFGPGFNRQRNEFIGRPA